MKDCNMMAPFELPEALEDVTNMVNSRPSFRQQRLKKNAEAPKKANYDENKDDSNIRQKVPRLIE
jgi:hypothetical protein